MLHYTVPGNMNKRENNTIMNDALTMIIKHTINALYQLSALLYNVQITEKCKKLKNSELSKVDFGRKDYIKNLDLQQARTKFKYRNSMTQHVSTTKKTRKHLLRQYGSAKNVVFRTHTCI